jgi:hypothetical protein
MYEPMVRRAISDGVAAKTLHQRSVSAAAADSSERASGGAATAAAASSASSAAVSVGSSPHRARHPLQHFSSHELQLPFSNASPSSVPPKHSRTGSSNVSAPSSFAGPDHLRPVGANLLRRYSTQAAEELKLQLDLEMVNTLSDTEAHKSSSRHHTESKQQ